MGLNAAPFPVVLDASFAIDAVQGDAQALAAFERWAHDARVILVPSIFWPEVANALLVRRRIARPDVVAALRNYRIAGVETADRGPDGVEHAIDLAAHHGLTVYDATYLALAIDVDAELATRDHALARAASAEDVLLAEAR